ncbi:serine hydrolase domain-containing protein [Qipengyuania sp. DSG2-2]|uniref:serine hydrolase domain-containing protein n=1 Tax=Qipengyuania sp. DGS2-2 TaxID=3349631 RepID=UPI0036D36F60
MSEPEEPRVPPASIAVVFDRESATPVIVEGLADRTTGRPARANDPVRIASISKLVMALAAMRLVDERKVDLNRDVSEYLGWPVRHPSYPDVPITLAQLMAHRSGLRDDAGYVIPLGANLEDKLRDPAAWYADAPPGEAPFEYANLGSPVVATVLEAASGERFDRLVERTVFAPLGVEACFNWIGCSREFAESAVTLYRSTGEVARDDAADRPPNCGFPVAEGVECTLYGYEPGTNASIFSPQGGVRIGMMDLAKIGQMLMNGPESEFFGARTLGEWAKALVDGISRDQEFFCAYGLHAQMIQIDPNCNDQLFDGGETHFGHAGEAYGLRSGLWWNGDGEKGIAYFTSAVPDRSAPDEGGFAPEEIALVRRAMAASKAQGGE